MKEIVRLSKEEIGDAIACHIALQKGRGEPYQIKTDLVIPEEVGFEIELIPKGATIDEYPHIFGKS